MGKVANAITMLELLANGRKFSIEELSSRLEVSPRMVRFYKEELEKAGIYVDTLRGPYGGYVLNQSIRIPARKFALADYQLLEQVKTEIKDQKTQAKLAILADKVHGVYQGSREEQKEISKADNAKYNAISKAIKEKRKVKLLYYSYNKGENARIIRPYELFLFQSGWGCAAFCELRKDLRHFELKRIHSFEILDETFE